MGIESCRKPAVFEKTNSLGFGTDSAWAFASSIGSKTIVAESVQAQSTESMGIAYKKHMGNS